MNPYPETKPLILVSIFSTQQQQLSRGYVSPDKKSMVDEDLDELKHHTGIDESAIKWTSPEQQKHDQLVS